MAATTAADAVDSSADGPGRRRSSPIRTCVGCRRRATKSELLRVVLDEGSLALDHHGHRPGRGAYLHPDPTCLDLAERRRALSRALRLSGGLDHTALRSAIGTSTALPPGRVAQQAALPAGTQSVRDTEAGRDGDERSMSKHR